MKLNQNITICIFLISVFVQFIIIGYNHVMGYVIVSSSVSFFIKLIIGTSFNFVLAMVLISLGIRIIGLPEIWIPRIFSKIKLMVISGILIGTIFTIVCEIILPCQNNPLSNSPTNFDYKTVVSQEHPPSIIFVSDTQQPIWIETLCLEENDNLKATSFIFNRIEHETSAQAIFHIGDITAIGMIDSYWKTFDDFQRKLKVPFYPVIGNHDYFYFKTPALKQYRKRFPARNTTWYSVVIKSLGIIALNSNFSKLSNQECTLQKQWYREQLSRFDNDSTINSIIVLSHHAPYTNSKIVDPSYEVQQHFLPPFLISEKASVFISGQSHAYEHFKKNRKNLFVIGGGGGLLHPLLTGPEQRYSDEFAIEYHKGFFHYLECSVKSNELIFTVHKLNNDFSGFNIVDSISVGYKY